MRCWGRLGGEGFAVEFCGKLVVRSWNRTRPTSDGVARSPGGGLVAEEAELEGEMGALGVDGGVDAGA